MDLQEWKAIGDAGICVAALIVSLRACKGDEKERQQSAALEIQDALTLAYDNTHAYYELRAKGERILSTERNLASNWEMLAHRVKPWDENLANRLGLKSRFWREGGVWDDEAIAAARIGLECIRAEVATLPNRVKK